MQIAVAGALLAASYAIDYFAAKKSRVQPVDRGRNDDIRLQGSVYGSMIPIIIGRTRIAPEIIYASGVRPVITVTPGCPDGKGTPSLPTPAPNNYQSFTDLRLQVCVGPLTSGIGKIRAGRI